MGRYYHGDIEGKFWNCVQESNDIENLINIESNKYYTWKVCGCIAEIKSDNYCYNCYENYEDHIKDVIYEEDYEDGNIYCEDESLEYFINKEEHYEELKINMNLISEKIPKEIITDFNNIEKNYKILNTSSGVFNNIIENIYNYYYDSEKISNEQIELIARYNLGFQIEYCLSINDFCNVYCEY